MLFQPHRQPAQDVLRFFHSRHHRSGALEVGHIFSVTAGDIIPADARLVTAQGLTCDQHVLTDDNRPVSKTPAQLHTRTPRTDQRNMIWAGTEVISGAGTAVVTAVGSNTALAHHQMLVASPGQTNHKFMGKKISVLHTSDIVDQAKATASDFDFLQGKRLLKNNGLVENPHISLTLTGLAVTNHSAGNKFSGTLGYQSAKMRQKWRRRDGLHFDPLYSYQAVLTDDPTAATQMLFVLGAPEILLEKSSAALDEHFTSTPITSARRSDLTQNIHALASGHHVLGLAVRENLTQPEITHHDTRGLLFLGVLLVDEPLQPDLSEALATARQINSDVKFFSGDHPARAQTLAREAGLAANVDVHLSGNAIRQMSDDELINLVEHTNVFSRLDPLDAQRLIRLLEVRGYEVTYGPAPDNR